jgi:adenylyl cyclase-associated protein
MSAILDRLEAATSRLEDIAVLQASVADVRSLETVVANVSPVAGVSEPPRIVPPPPAVIEEPPSVVAFDEGVGGQLKIFLQLSEQLSPILKEQVRALLRCIPS